MAQYKIQISAGPLTSSKTSTNDAMQTALELFVAAQGGPEAGTPQQQLDFVRDKLIEHILTVAKSRHRQMAISQADAQANTDAKTWTWT